MKNRVLWNNNRYEVVRKLWCRVLPFGNAVLCMKSDIPARLEVKQRDLGRLALGAYVKTPNQEVQGDMGWSLFEDRDASSEIEFEESLRYMEEDQNNGHGEFLAVCT